MAKTLNEAWAALTEIREGTIGEWIKSQVGTVNAMSRKPKISSAAKKIADAKKRPKGGTSKPAPTKKAKKGAKDADEDSDAASSASDMDAIVRL